MRLEGVRVIEPCVEFSRYALGRLGRPAESLERVGPSVTETLIFLRFGMRGYCATYATGPTTVRLGDRLYAE